MQPGADGTPYEEQLSAGGLGFTLPHLSRGPLVGVGGGSLFPQPVTDDGSRLDQVVGARFVVIARGHEYLGAVVDWWRDEFNAMVTTVADLGVAGAEVRRWLDRCKANVVVVRPDRYVLGTGSTLADISPIPLRELFVPVDAERGPG
jgi:3-(3-hydroxy-phenyl)propionate hydroxylase